MAIFMLPLPLPLPRPDVDDDIAWGGKDGGGGAGAEAVAPANDELEGSMLLELLPLAADTVSLKPGVPVLF